MLKSSSCFYFLDTIMTGCGCARLTCMRSMESDSEQALLMRYVCSMYSVILCRKLSGSLRTMGIVIFDSSCAKRKFIYKHGVWIFNSDLMLCEVIYWILTRPMHFFRILQILTLFLENIGAGRRSLKGYMQNYLRFRTGI